MGQGALRDAINAAVKDAMKSGDKRRLSTLRLVTAAIKDRDIAARVDDQGAETGRERIEENEILALLQKMIKQRRESIETYATAGRTDLADQETAEIAVIEEFLPRQMEPAEVEAAIAALVSEIGAQGLKDMGRTMAALKERFAGRMDFTKASALVKAKLS